MQKLGIHSKEYVDALDQNQHKLLSKQTLRDEEKHCTPKSMKPEWSTKAGEVGHYVEVKAGGGIAGFSIRREEGTWSSYGLQVVTYTPKPVYFQTGAISFWSPCTEFLISMRNKGYTHFTPGPRDWIIKSPPVFIKISKCSPDIPISPSPSCWSDSDGGMLTSESQGEGEWFQMDPEEEIPKHGPSWITSPSGTL